MKKQVLFVLTFILAAQWSGVPAGMNVNPENLKGPGEVETQEHVKAENLEECPICCNKMDNPVALPCEKPHFICVGCLSKLTKATASHANVPCPICRKEYTHETVQLLLKIKTNVLSQEDLFDALKNAILAHKVNADNVKIVVLILDSGLDVNFKPALSYETPLSIAISKSRNGNYEQEILKIILKKGALTQEYLRASFFSICIQRYGKEAAIILLEHFKKSHDVDAVKNLLNNSLKQAEHTAPIDVLIECGADKDSLVASRMAEIYKKINTQTNKYRDFDGRVRPGRLDIIIPSKEEIEKYVQQYYPDFKYTE